MLTGYIVLRNKASSPETGLAVADAEFTGIGRDDDPRRSKTNVKVYDPGRKLIIGKERNVRLPFQTCVRVRRMALHGSVKGMETGLAVADAEFTGIGRDDDPRRSKTNVKVYDPVNRKS
jgi:hypothetical protein